MNHSLYLRRTSVVVLLALVLASTTGCVGLLAQIGYWSGANLVPAEYTGLEKSRVAVICVSSNAAYGVGIEAELLSRNVTRILQERVKDIKLVSQDEIGDWVDQNDWDEVDYREVGRGVKADKVVAIDISGFRLYEGQTLYRGRAEVTVTVYDIKEGGKEVFRRKMPEIKFPTSAAYHSSETTESVFRQLFIDVVARQIGHYFHEYDMADRYGRDPASLD